MRLLSRRLLDDLIPGQPSLSVRERRLTLDGVEGFLAAEMAAAPLHIRIGCRVLAAALRVWMALGLAAGGSRLAALDAWDRLPLGPTRAFTRLARSLSLLAFYEHPLVLRRLGVSSVADRQARQRAARQETRRAAGAARDGHGMGAGPHRLSGPAEISCDVLIIGSGAGGATVADRLTEAGLDVVMIEEGPYLDARRAPKGVCEGVNRMWRAGGLTVGLGSPPLAYAEGRCVGGTTEINSAIMQRAPDALLAEWAGKYAIEDFSPQALAPFYSRAEAMVNASLTTGRLGPPSDKLREGAQALGWQVKALARAQQHCVGTNLCAIGCPTGGKQSMTATAIPRALARGLRLIAETRVTRLVIKGGRVVEAHAVATGHDGRRSPVTVRPEAVFCCAGAVHTAALLRRSGVKHRVGDTLRVHPTVKVVARFNEDLHAHAARLPLYAITEFMPEQRIGGSVFQPGFFGMSLAEDWAKRSWLAPEWRRCGLYYAMVRARGCGTVRPLPGGAVEPLVRFTLEEADRRGLGEALKRLAQAMFAAGASHVYPPISGHGGWTGASQLAELDQALLPSDRTNLLTIHLFSTCPPGEARALCATDSFGRVRGTANLVLADASQIPEAPGVNPQLTIMALALRAGEAFLSSSKRTTARVALRDAA